MLYSTTINDASVYGITAAREAYNETLRALVLNDQGQEIDNPNRLKTDAAYLDMILQRAIEGWCKQYAPVVVTPPPPVVVNGVPQEVTMRQAQLALLAAGLLDDVEAAINSIPGDAGRAARITWTKSSAVKRDNPLIMQMAAALGKTPQQIDGLFILASTL